MADLPHPTTQLEAVNILLDAIQVAPVNTLEGALNVDGLKAIAKLAQVSRTVQTEAWQFNSETGFPLSRNGDDEIVVPLNTISIAGCRGVFGDVTQRGPRLYDRKRHTFKFDQDIKVDIVLQLPFDELPEFARQYVTIRAAREFQQKEMGDATLDKFSELDMVRARADMIRNDGKAGNLNILNGLGTYQPGAVLRR